MAEQTVVASDAEQRMALQLCASWRNFKVLSVNVDCKDLHIMSSPASCTLRVYCCQIILLAEAVM
jgi:hypothetical protein